MFKKNVLIGLSTVIFLPVAAILFFGVYFVGIIAYTGFSEETVYEQQLSSGETIRVTKKVDGGFTGPGYYYYVYYKQGIDSGFLYVTGWNRPPGKKK